jgi:hypothetical protein
MNPIEHEEIFLVLVMIVFSINFHKYDSRTRPVCSAGMTISSDLIALYISVNIRSSKFSLLFNFDRFRLKSCEEKYRINRN